MVLHPDKSEPSSVANHKWFFPFSANADACNHFRWVYGSCILVLLPTTRKSWGWCATAAKGVLLNRLCQDIHIHSWYTWCSHDVTSATHTFSHEKIVRLHVFAPICLCSTWACKDEGGAYTCARRHTSTTPPNFCMILSQVATRTHVPGCLAYLHRCLDVYLFYCMNLNALHQNS